MAGTLGGDGGEAPPNWLHRGATVFQLKSFFFFFRLGQKPAEEKFGFGFGINDGTLISHLVILLKKTNWINLFLGNSNFGKLKFDKVNLECQSSLHLFKQVPVGFASEFF